MVILYNFSRQIVGVLLVAPVHKRNASYWIYCSFCPTDDVDRKNAAMPCSITERTSALHMFSSGRLAALQLVPVSSVRRFNLSDI